MSALDDMFAAYQQRLVQAVIAGLDDAAPLFEQAAEANARARFHGQTGATFAGIYAIVDGQGVDSSGVVQQAVAAVQARNPAHVHTEAAPTPPDTTVRLLGSVPTDYIDKLEASSQRAFLAATLDQEGGAIAAAIETALTRAI